MGFCLGCGPWELLFTREDVEGREEKGKGNRMRGRGNRSISEAGGGSGTKKRMIN